MYMLHFAGSVSSVEILNENSFKSRRPCWR